MALTKIWKLRNLTKGEAFKTADELGIDNIRARFLNMATDTVSLPLAGQKYDIVAPWDYGDEVQIQRDGVLWFRGVITATPRTGTGSTEGISYELGGVWWWLENTNYQQDWATGSVPGPPANPGDPLPPLTLSTVTMSQARLFVDGAGAALTLAQQVSAIFNYAQNEAGIPIQVGTLPDAVTPWPTEAKDATLAQVLRQVMRWAPATQMQVDYSTSPPTCNFIKRSSALAENLTLSNEQKAITQNTIRSREDLKPKAVCITYEFDNQYQDVVFRDVETDIWPASSNCKLPGTLNVTVPMRGYTHVSEVVAVKTVRIPDLPKRTAPGGNPLGTDNNPYGSNSVSGRAYWRNKMPILKAITDATKMVIDVPAGGITFSEDTGEQDPPEPRRWEPRKLREKTTVEDYPREVVDGEIDEWMGAVSRSLDVTGSVYFTGTNAEFDALPKRVQKVFSQQAEAGTMAVTENGNVDVGGKQFYEFDMQVNATNLLTKNYSRTLSSIAKEEVPSGLAQHYYEQHSLLHWDGSVDYVEKEVGQQVLIGRVLNITNGHALWATMKAQIQQYSVNVAQGQTSVVFGAPEHLNIQDMLTQLQLEKSTPLSPQIARADASRDPSSGSSRSDKSVRGYVKAKSAVQIHGGGGGGGDSCTNLKVTLVANGASYDLAVTPGTVDTTTLMHTSTITAPTKVWIVVDGLAGVTENPAGSGVFEYDGTVALSNHRILVQVADPTSIPVATPTSASSVAMVYAMQAAEIYDDGGTLKVRAAKCGDRVTKWCPPQSFYFNPT